jgi:hypothetical protein
MQTKFFAFLIAFADRVTVLKTPVRLTVFYELVRTINKGAVVLYECETWSLTLKEENRLRVYENRVLRRIFGPKRQEDGRGENCIMMNCTACILHRILR